MDAEQIRELDEVLIVWGGGLVLAAVYSGYELWREWRWTNRT